MFYSMKNDLIKIYYCRKYWKFVSNYIDSLFIKYHPPIKNINSCFRFLSEEQLIQECGISNSIHRYRILDSIRGKCCDSNKSKNERDYKYCCFLSLIDMETLIDTSSYEENMNKNLDVFISYRRSTGSQLAR